MKITISQIVAIDENNGIGKNNKLLWNIPEDLKRFNKITINHPIIMGRKTFESIGKVLKKRLNIIITRNQGLLKDDIHTIKTDNIEKAIELAKKEKANEIFIIGGAEIYKASSQFIDKIYITLVKGKYNADTFFYDYKDFKKCIFFEKHKNKNNTFTYITLVK